MLHAPQWNYINAFGGPQYKSGVRQLNPGHSLLSDLITSLLLLFFLAIIVVQCLQRKRCYPMWPLLQSDLQDETSLHTKIYSMLCWHKENLTILFSIHQLHCLRKKKKGRKDIFKLGKWIKFLIVSVTFWFQASLHAKSEVSSVLSCKTSPFSFFTLV